MTKFAALGAYLEHSDALQITLSFKDIERIVGGRLPGPAKLERGWWMKRRGAKTRPSEAWTRAGWQVFFADIHRGEVTFVKYRLAKATGAS